MERGRAFDLPKYKKSGYVVNVEEAFKERLPYTLTFLNPLPILFREDYIYHLLLKDRSLPYMIYPEENHADIDKLNLILNDLLKRDSIEVINLHKELIKNMSDFNSKVNQVNNKNDKTIKIKEMLMPFTEENYKEIPLN